MARSCWCLRGGACPSPEGGEPCPPRRWPPADCCGQRRPLPCRGAQRPRARQPQLPAGRWPRVAPAGPTWPLLAPVVPGWVLPVRLGSLVPPGLRSLGRFPPPGPGTNPGHIPVNFPKRGSFSSRPTPYVVGVTADQFSCCQRPGGVPRLPAASLRLGDALPTAAPLALCPCFTTRHPPPAPHGCTARPCSARCCRARAYGAGGRRGASPRSSEWRQGVGVGAVLPPGGLHSESLMWGLHPGHAGDGGKGRGLATGSETSGPGKRGGSGGPGRTRPGAKVSWRCGAGAGKGLWDGEGLMGEIWSSL